MLHILQQTCVIIAIFSASQGIKIEYCFGSQSTSSSKNEPSCDQGQQGTMMFRSGDVSSFRAQLSSASNPPLLVVCESKEPIQIRLNLPRVEIYVPFVEQGQFLEIMSYRANYIKAWSDTGSFLQYTSESNVSYFRWIEFESLKFFSGIVRCESTSKSTTWSQLFIAPSTYPVFFNLGNPINLFVPDIDTSNSSIVVPCIGGNYSSDPGPPNFELYKRPLHHSFYTNEMNQDCIASLCDTMDRWMVPGFGPFRNIMGSPPMGDECRKYIKNATDDIQDCNSDEIVTCTDAMTSFPMIKDICVTHNVLYEQAIAFGHLSINHHSLQNKENVQRQNDAVYNNNLGFVVPNASWDYYSEYLCSIDPMNLSETDNTIVQGFVPLDTRKELDVTIELIGNELSCKIDQSPLKHILRKRQTQFWVMDCRSLADCDLQFRPNMGLGQPTMKSKHKDSNTVVNVDFVQASSIDSQLLFRLPLEFENALVGCTGIFLTNGTAPFYARNFRYLFSGFDKRPHFIDQDLPSEVSIQLTAKNVDEGEEQVLTCRFSAFHFHGTCVFIIEHAKGRMKFESKDLSGVKEKGATMNEEKLSNLWEKTLTIRLESGEYRARCSAPRLDAAKWEHADISIKVQDALSIGAIVGIFLGVLFVVLSFLAVYLLIKNRRTQEIIRKLTPDEVAIFLKGGAKGVDANPSPSYIDVDNIGFPTELQINSSSLRIFKNAVLGEGEFGKCMRGEWKNMAVAVKIPKPSADLDYFRAFLREVKIMGFIGDHSNIVKLHGAVVSDLKNGQCSAVLELSPFGNLHSLLREYSSASSGGGTLYRKPRPSSFPIVLTSRHMADFSCQIATGMEYLSEKKVIHGDLAARNVLMYPHLTLKITDFGLSRKLYNSSMYAKKSKTMLPWRWMAFESLKHLNFSLLSDVWAFGMTIWEIYTLGQTPFGGLTWSDEFLKDLEDGKRPPKPLHADERVYKLMLLCWELLPADRPAMSQVKEFFLSFITEQHESYYQKYTDDTKI